MGKVSFGHALDGYSKIIRFNFDKGGVSLSTDFLQSAFYRNSLKANTVVPGMLAAETRPPTRAGFGPLNGLGPNDNNYIKPQRIGGQEIMTSDTLYLTEMDQEYWNVTHTIKPLPVAGDETANAVGDTSTWQDDITPLGHICVQATMAHGDIDENGGYNATMGCQTVDLLSQYHIIFHIDPARVSRRELVAKIKLRRRPSYMHQNGATESSHVIVGTPLYMDLMGVMSGKGLAEGGLEPVEGDPTIFQIVDKSDGSWREFHTGGFLIGHVVNSYDDGEDVVVDVTYSTVRSGGFFRRFLLSNILDKVKRDLFEKGTVMRFRLSPNGTVTRSLTLPKEPAADIELPAINPAMAGKAYCIFWGVQFGTEGRSFASTALVKRNICTGEAINKFTEGHYVSEHKFIPDPSSDEEDGGVLVGLVFDGFTKKSYLQVVDARTMEQLATADLGLKVPFPVHATWYPDARGLTLVV